MQLYAGWNSVGWTGDDGLPLADAFGDLEVAAALIWDPSRQAYDAFAAAAPLIINTLDSLDFASAVWVRVAGAQEWRMGDVGIITTVAGLVREGDRGPATAAQLSVPTGVALDGAGNLFIADTLNNRVRRVDAASGVITTVAGTGENDSDGFGGDGGPATEAELRFPTGVVLDGAGNLFIADTANFRVRRVDAASGVITTVAGTGEQGSGGEGGPATAAQLDILAGAALDWAANLFIADAGNKRIWRVAGVAVPVTIWPGIGPGQ